MESSCADRIIVLVDMDCFYVQVEQKLCPEYLNTPCAVVQYKTWKGGGIIAVNYEARARGVTRFLRGDEAVEKCPDIHLFRVPEIRGKADLTRYREAGALVLDVLCEYSDCVERASIDEAYLDMTSVINSRIQNTPPVTADQLPNTFVVGWEGEDPESRMKELQRWLQMIYEEEHLYNDRMLAVTAVIVEEMRAAVYEKTGYRCSAGIAHNKMLAKLSCGINKPNKQTLLPQSSIQILFKTMPIKKVRNLGGKLGKAVIEKFNVEKMGDLIDIPRSQFVSHFGEKTGHWLYNLVRGVDNELVTSRQLPKSIGCGKNFPGKSALSTKHDVTHWLKQLATELEERLIKDQNTNKRFARLLTVSVRNFEGSGYSLVSRSCPIHVYNADKLAHDALMALSKLNTSSSDTLWKPYIYTLSMVASKFEDRIDYSHCNIQSYLVNKKNTERKSGINNDETSASSVIFSAESMSRTSEPLNSSTLKSAKNSSKTIASFFSKKQRDKTESNDYIGELVKAKDNIGELGDAKVDLNLCCNREHISSDCLVVEESDEENVSDGKFTDTSVKETSAEENSNDVTDKQVKPVGFFAKKLAERLEFNVDFEFQSSCNQECLNNEEFKGENESLLTESNITSLPSTSFQDVSSNLDPELTKLCEQCNKRIPIWEEIEHLDYHMALSLSKELSSKPTNSDSFPSKSTNMGKSASKSKSKAGGNRKRGSVTKSSSHAKKSFVQKNTLDAFIK